MTLRLTADEQAALRERADATARNATGRFIQKATRRLPVVIPVVVEV